MSVLRRLYTYKYNIHFLFPTHKSTKYAKKVIKELKHAVNEYFKTSGIKCIGTVVCCKTDIEKSVPIRKLHKLDKILLLRISSNNV